MTPGDGNATPDAHRDSQPQRPSVDGRADPAQPGRPAPGPLPAREVALAVAARAHDRIHLVVGGLGAETSEVRDWPAGTTFVLGQGKRPLLELYETVASRAWSASRTTVLPNNLLQHILTDDWRPGHPPVLGRGSKRTLTAHSAGGML